MILTVIRMAVFKINKFIKILKHYLKLNFNLKKKLVKTLNKLSKNYFDINNIIYQHVFMKE